MNRKQRRAKGGHRGQGLSRAEFARELRRAVDPSVAAFWAQHVATTGIRAAVPNGDGIEVLRHRTPPKPEDGDA